MHLFFGVASGTFYGFLSFFKCFCPFMFRRRHTAHCSKRFVSHFKGLTFFIVWTCYPNSCGYGLDFMRKVGASGFFSSFHKSADLLLLLFHITPGQEHTLKFFAGSSFFVKNKAISFAMRNATLSPLFRVLSATTMILPIHILFSILQKRHHCLTVMSFLWRDCKWWNASESQQSYLYKGITNCFCKTFTTKIILLVDPKIVICNVIKTTSVLRLKNLFVYAGEGEVPSKGSKIIQSTVNIEPITVKRPCCFRWKLASSTWGEHVCTPEAALHH